MNKSRVVLVQGWISQESGKLRIVKVKGVRSQGWEKSRKVKGGISQGK